MDGVDGVVGVLGVVGVDGVIGVVRVNLGLIRVALLLYPPRTRPLGPLPDPYLIPGGYLIHRAPKVH